MFRRLHLASRLQAAAWRALNALEKSDGAAARAAAREAEQTARLIAELDDESDQVGRRA